MRVALIVPAGVGRDGVHLVIPALLDLVEALAAGHSVLVAALDQEPEPAGYDLRGARVVCLGQDRRRGPRFARLMGALRPFRPDVVHSFWLGATSSLALLAGRGLGAPTVASLGGGELVALPRISYGGRLDAGTRLHAGLALRLAAAVTAGSAYALAPLLRRRPDARRVPLGARAAGEPAPLERPAGPPWSLLHIASINRVKGPEVLLRAVAAARAELRATTGHPEPMALDWVGQDVLGGEAQALAAALGLGGAVRFHGWRPHAAVVALCRSAHLYLQASYHESQGVAVCEAAAAGAPTVGTAVGLVAELAPAAAVAVPPGDPAALGRAIAATLRDPARREALGRAAQAWALAHDAAWTARAFTGIYAATLGRPCAR
ncbi:MAG TPA: glycosyltransferase [Chloroflexaceae bacterium]|nr:glycosyltransferase [Chloroflexaceae bacterium]